MKTPIDKQLRMRSWKIPVIDLFAGPGGLGEGFSSLKVGNDHPFDVRLSVEKDQFAHRTLRLRSFYRQFQDGDAPECYYDVLRQRVSVEQLPDKLAAHAGLLEKWDRACRESLCLELGASEAAHAELRREIASRLGEKGAPWILIGGPPCQAYSIAGRVRNRGKHGYRIEDDSRSSLYREYLRIIADHWPSVFIMENVKGLLSAKYDNSKIFTRIVADLESPLAAFGEEAKPSPRRRYRVVPVVSAQRSLLGDYFDPRDFLIPCERYGIPQIRHRLILVGIREDLQDAELPPLRSSKLSTVGDVISDLPPLRSGVSKKRGSTADVYVTDSPELWMKTLKEQTVRNDWRGERRWLKNLRDGEHAEVYRAITSTLDRVQIPLHDRGAEFIEWQSETPLSLPWRKWFADERLGGVCNHQARTHMDRDLARYLFASCFAQVHGLSPRLPDFPTDLQPDHINAGTGDFNDRFRVQWAGKPSSTITSHISKDGHYFIHPDPAQCRSLTVREAARLQTFPDNYYFCGPRTAQYVQVGNAVPPLLAYQIAESVFSLLSSAGKAG